MLRHHSGAVGMPDQGEPRTLRSARVLRLQYEIPIAGIARFWDELGEGRLVTTRCRRCRTLYFPPVADCSKCRSSEVRWIRLSGEAVLEALTQIHLRPASFSDEEPYVVAVGRLTEGVKALARLVGVGVEEARIGMRLMLRPSRTPAGALSYEFVPLAAVAARTRRVRSRASR